MFISTSRRILLVVLLGCTIVSAERNTFDRCKTRVAAILDGQPDPYGNLTKEDVEKYIYTGPVKNLSPNYPRDKYVTLTLEGCQQVCNSPIDWYLTSDPTLSLSIAANWILPILALVACLPWDSLHARTPAAPFHAGRLAGTLKTLLHWLGSPATALTATLHNIHQLRRAHRYTFFPGGTHEQATNEHHKRNAYYVLSCLAQFALPPGRADRAEMVDVLAYGLFRPIVPPEAAHASRPRAAGLRTRELLEALAFQLRMFRRRGVYPAGINIVVFLGAFAISVGLAFADLGAWTTAHSLALGLLVSWLPVLVMFSLVDRNPVSAVRNRVLMERWLWNIEAVRLWETAAGVEVVQGDGTTVVERPGEDKIDWWDPAKQHRREDSEREGFRRGPSDISVVSCLELGEFVGQGRKMGYYGLTADLLDSVYRADGRRLNSIADIAKSTNSRLESSFKRPASWWFIAVASITTVWLEILMAFLVSYQTPTVGLSCRSGSYLAYGVLASVSWIISCVHKSPGFWTRAVCYFFNALAVLVLLTIIFAQFSGVFNNCPCRCGSGGYMGFQDSHFFQENFGVATWWIVGSVLGGLPPIICFIVSALLNFKLKKLWRASEQSQPSWQLTNWSETPAQGGAMISANMLWLT
ncbi:hypothetical protein B0H67DRAFT_497363 [Lasiosphaeris hirsuta]|uniref:Uncharacterized protein n=1 Tax=Lasiosphaeris hirsuta TaxID=260670 RepID=A0AA40DLY0_9PEZI|nr:hypothetical protein B0H67DRAFT_497363 [Lasiosphaeris hirsuta]